MQQFTGKRQFCAAIPDLRAERRAIRQADGEPLRCAPIMRTFAIIVAAIVAIIVLPFVPALIATFSGTPPSRPEQNLPWQIEPQPDGSSRVFGLQLGRSTLAEARQRLGPDLQVALVIAPGETGTLEAYYESFNAGFVTGKMVLTIDTTPAMRADMLKRAQKAEYMESSTRRIQLNEADQHAAEQLPVSVVAFIPSAQLDEQVVLQRFGQPAERLRGTETREHFLYPDLGLDLMLDTKGKELLQYVAPRDFARLRAPLAAAAGQATAR